MSRHFEIGSIWRKWDLHFHTPSSYDYDDQSITNQDIVDKLISNNIEVVAITDHHVIDINRIKELVKLAKDKITILPGIEFRADVGGSDNMHFIGIFSEATTNSGELEYIWNKISSTANISDYQRDKVGNQNIQCKFEETVELIRQLGGVVSVHAGNKSNTIENITNALTHKQAQKRKYLKFIDFYEIGKISDEKDYLENVYPHIKKIKNPPMIICSDNHNIKKYKLKENCWIKGDPCFNALRSCILEPRTRVSIKSEPTDCLTQKANPDKYIKKINIIASKDKHKNKWFNTMLTLNPGLVSIIGRKGSGKSALADIISLLGDTHIDEDDFSFLHRSKFKSKGFANNYSGELKWSDGKSKTKTLSDKVNSSTIELVRYLPQQHIENICNEIGVSKKFQTEINKVVFSYVLKTKRLGTKTLEELIEKRTQSEDDKIKNIRSKLDNKIKSLISLEMKTTSSYKEKLEAELNELNRKLGNLSEPKKVEKPQDHNAEAEKNLLKFTKVVEDLTDETNKSELELDKINSRILLCNNIRANMESLGREYDELKLTLKTDLDELGLNFKDLIKLDLTYKSLDSKLKELQKRQCKLELLLQNEEEAIADSNKNSLHYKIKVARKKADQARNKLDAPQEKFELYRKAHKNYLKNKKEIEGPNKNKSVKTISSISEELLYLKGEITEDIEKQYNTIYSVSETIFDSIHQKIKIYEDVYSPLIKFIEVVQTKMDVITNKLLFNVEIRNNDLLTNDFLNFINQSHTGKFKGKQEGINFLIDIIKNVNFNNKKDVIGFIKNIIKILKLRKTKDNSFEFLITQIRRPEQNLEKFFKYLFSLEYIDVIYQILLDEKKLNDNEFSPGEKGAVLLIFYLLIDQDSIPLIIDQPEGNLDNESVYNILVKYINIAKSRRQVFIVTHNPNLAIVCDSDQIIHCSMDKKKNVISYECGSLENPKTIEYATKILEGTIPAFEIRRSHYKIV